MLNWNKKRNKFLLIPEDFDVKIKKLKNLKFEKKKRKIKRKKDV